MLPNGLSLKACEVQKARHKKGTYYMIPFTRKVQKRKVAKWLPEVVVLLVKGMGTER